MDTSGYPDLIIQKRNIIITIREFVDKYLNIIIVARDWSVDNGSVDIGNELLTLT